jgi:hypothetical protein
MAKYRIYLLISLCISSILLPLAIAVTIAISQYHAGVEYELTAIMYLTIALQLTLTSTIVAVVLSSDIPIMNRISLSILLAIVCIVAYVATAFLFILMYPVFGWTPA